MNSWRLRGQESSGPAADAARPQAKGDTPTSPVGAVEGLGPKYAWGWTDWSGAAPPQIAVTCGGESFPVFARWIARPDVTASGKAINNTPGFQFGLPLEALRKLLANPSLADSFAVTVNGARLPFEHGVHAAMPDPVTWNQLPLEFMATVAGKDVVAEAWLYLPFRLYLRFPDGATAPESVRLLCNDTPLECMSLRTREAPSGAAEEEDRSAPVLFEFELPGLVWEMYAEAGQLAFVYQADAATFPKIPFVVTHAHARAWLEQQAKDGPHDSYNQMLAVEHAHFVAAALELDRNVLDYLELAARSHGLDGYLQLPVTVDAEATEALRKTGHNSMLLWQALREFNAKMPAWKGREEELLATVEQWLSQGWDRTVFVEYLAAYFFRTGRPEVIKPRIAPARLEDMINGTDTFSLAMAVPLLVEHGHIERATEVLHRLADKSGWLATDALAAASVQAVEQARMSATHEKFADALINVIDVIAADYFSRLFDVQLINAFCAWLEKPAFWTDVLWRDLVRAAIRNYGMSPEFWLRMEASLASDEPLFDELRQARFRFSELRDGLVGWSSDAPMAPSVRENIAYFQRAGNHEVARILRELVTSKLLAVSNTDDVVPNLPVQEMMAIHFAESARLAALPVASDKALIDRMPGLRQTLARMQGDVTHTSRYTLQRRAGFMLHHLESGGAADLAGSAIELQREVESFGDADNEFLSVDVLARLWRIAGHTEAGSMLSRALVKHAQQGLNDGALWPAQPVMAGLACARRALAEKPDSVLKTYMQQINLLMDERYRERRKVLERVLEPPKKVKMSAPIGQDTLVVVYSCRKYLDTRVQAIRDSWLLDIKARGIPYVILVGDGKDEIEGDVLGLAVSDRYEDLPAKTLAMVKWVEEHTDFQFLLKIDDDCFLNVAEYFDSLSYRKFHYYGRVIRRKLGSMDRKWHQEKSQGKRAQRSVDKSPEPAVYADGGGAYSLSRLAMTLLCTQAETDAGKRLRASSFMEDKLLGDLLAPTGIAVSNEDYFTLIRRRFGTNATPVAIWDNVFAPSVLSPVKFAHLDTAVDMVPFRERLQSRSLWPRKIWPTYAVADLWWNKNQLELLTPLADVRRLLQEPLVVVAVMRNELVMAPHFLGHYRKLGVKTFIIVDNISDDGTREYLLEQPDVILYSADSEYKESVFGVAWQQAVLANHCVGKWALVADADELLVYPGCEEKPITEMLAEVDAAGYDTVCINMVDMYPFGDLEDADFGKMNPFEAAPCFDNPPLLPWRLSTGYYSNYPNRVSALRHRQMPAAEPHAFTAQKFCLVRYAPWMRFCAGLHNVANAKIAPDALAFAHFKYHAGFKKKVEEEVKRKQHFGDAAEYRKYLGMLAEGRGSFGQEGVSARYVDSVSFVAAARKDGVE